MRFEDSIETTINLLSAARVAIYPVDVRGTTVQQFYTAENTSLTLHHHCAAVAGRGPRLFLQTRRPQRRGDFPVDCSDESEKRGNQQFDDGHAR